MRYFKASKTEIRDRKRRLAVAAITAMAGFASLPIADCQAGRPSHGAIYRTLDALAGGIEKVIDVAGRATTRGRSCDASSCDEASCDDGCDAMTLHELEAASGNATPIYTDTSIYDIPHGSQVKSGPNSHLSEPTIAPPLAHPTPPRKNPTNSMPRSKSMPAPQPMRESMQSVQPMQSAPQPMQSAPQPMQSAPQPMREPTPQPMLNPQPMSDLAPMREPLQPVDDGWFDSLSPQPMTPTGERPIPRPRALRSPADTIDTLEDPFKDDTQGRRWLKSANQPASYWQPW